MLAIDKLYREKLRRSEQKLVSQLTEILTFFIAEAGSESGLTPNDLHKLPNLKEIKLLTDAVNELPDDLPEQAQKRVDLLKKQAAIDKQHLISSIAGLTFVALTAKHQKEMHKRFTAEYLDEVTRLKTLYGLEEPKFKAIKSNVDSVILTPIDNVRWDDRLWAHSDTASNLASNSYNKAVIRNAQANELVHFKQDLTKIVHSYNSGVTADYVGDSNRINEEAEVAFYGLRFPDQLLDILTQPGACKICEQAASDGPYTADAMPSFPLHSNCRCMIMIHI